MGASAIPIIGGALGLYSAGSAARNQKRAARAQEGIARNQKQLMGQASPYYNEVLKYLAGNAGLPIPGAGAQPGIGSSAGTPLPSGSGSLPDAHLGVFNQDQAAFRQAEEDLGRQRDRRSQELSFRLGQRGAGQATIASALSQNEGDYQTQLAAFRRNLALAARAEQERRVGALLGALNPGLGAGASAAGIYGGQAGMYGNQALAAGQGVGSFLSNWMLAEALKKQANRPQIPGGWFPIPGWPMPGG